MRYQLILKTIQMGLASLMIVQAATTSTPVIPVSDQIKEAVKSEAVAQDLDPKLALAIVRCESHFRQFDETTGEVLRGVRNPEDVGVFQINEKYHLEKAKDLGYNIYTADGNIDYGVHLLKTQGVRHWNSSRACWGQS